MEKGKLLLLSIVRIWWEGVKVFTRWLAFSIALSVLFTPVTWLLMRAENALGNIAAGIILVVLGPVAFFACSRYLNLMRGNELPLECPHCQQSITVKDLQALRLTQEQTLTQVDATEK